MLDSFFDRLSAGAEVERQIAALRELTDHELADLGILRDQIEAYVLERAAAARE